MNIVLGDNVYKASYAVAKITVTKQTPKITAKKATYKVRIEFKKITELEELPTKNITMDLTFAVNYVQK